MRRFADNPLLTPQDVSPSREGLRVVCTLNPAAARSGEEVLLLVRVGESPEEEDNFVSTVVYDAGSDQTRIVRFGKDDPDLDLSDPRKVRYRGRALLSSLSHLRIARSRDGRNFTFDPQPFVFPSTPYEAFGCEDPRIVELDGRFWITYTAVSEMGVAVALGWTSDFVQFTRRGLIFPPFNKDVCLFPQKIRDRYVCRHRPYKSVFSPASIWTAYSPDLLAWGDHRMVLAPQPGTWLSERVGAGAPPIRTEQGWLEVFHGCDENRRYCLGAMLSELDQPDRIVGYSTRPVLEPQAQYEKSGLFSNVVFSGGVVLGDDGQVLVYYGAADCFCAGAETSLEELLAAARR